MRVFTCYVKASILARKSHQSVVFSPGADFYWSEKLIKKGPQIPWTFFRDLSSLGSALCVWNGSASLSSCLLAEFSCKWRCSHNTCYAPFCDRLAVPLASQPNHPFMGRAKKIQKHISCNSSESDWLARIGFKEAFDISNKTKSL